MVIQSLPFLHFVAHPFANVISMVELCEVAGLRIVEHCRVIEGAAAILCERHRRQPSRPNSSCVVIAHRIFVLTVGTWVCWKEVSGLLGW